jgi:ADP-ribosyl-[dinitrogen reductase] hydrolase
MSLEPGKLAPMSARTSLTHPLRIDEVSCAPQAPGTIGVTICPGKCGDSVFGAPCQRDLQIDVRAIRDWRAAAAITLIQDHELDLLNVRGLEDAFAQEGIQWIHMPIPDLRAPGPEFDPLWRNHAETALGVLRRAGKVLVHCRGGLGRAGTVASMLLIELGASPEEALRRVRTARPGTVETSAQERYVRAFGGTGGKGV